MNGIPLALLGTFSELSKPHLTRSQAYPMKISPFLMPPPQRVPRDMTSGVAEEAAYESSTSRRNFIKRTGGASVAAIVAAGLGTHKAYGDYADDVIMSNFWSMVFDLLFSDDPPSTPPPSTPPPSAPPPSTPPPCEHEWQYTIEGEDNYSYWGTKTCSKCGATGTFRSLKPNVA
jgi:hypothetical protein